MVGVSTSAAQPGGERFGRYVLLELIGRGGMAEVYRAVAHGLEGFQRVFVIKRILKEKCATPEFVEMFINEARISALLNHPNIVQIYDFGQIDGSYFLAMEHLRGKDLLSVLRQLRTQGRRMTAEVAAYIAQQVALGLDYAHSLSHGGKSLNIVHRDVSPSNIMLMRAGGVKLLDFGIAKAAMEIRTDNETQAGLVKGKLSYVSPEQIRGSAVIDGRSDIFALGVVLWETLTGRRLFFDRNEFQTMRNVLERPVPPPSTQRSDIPPALDFIVLRALEREPARRYPDAKSMADELESVLQEARFAPRATTRMLDDLFGEQSQEVEAMVGDRGAGSGPGTQRDDNKAPIHAPILEPVTMPQPGAAAPLGEPVLDDGPEAYTGVSSVRRLPTLAHRKLPWMAAAAGVALAALGTVAVVKSSSRSRVVVAALETSPLASPQKDQAPEPFMPVPSTTRGPVAPPAAPSPAQPERVVEIRRAAPAEKAETSEAVEGVAPPPPAATPTPIPSPSGEPPGASAADTVSVKIQSDPAGAEVKLENGKVLGVTPATLSLPRSARPTALVISKPGFVPSRHSIVPDRDVSALLTLRAEEDSAKKKAAQQKRKPKGGDGRVREGLSIDPFAEDPAPKK